MEADKIWAIYMYHFCLSDHLLCVLLQLKMTSIKYTENGLNVEYISKFLDTVQYFEQLKSLPYPVTDTLTYGEDSLPNVILRLRDVVEKHMAYSYNLIIVQRLPSGSSHAIQQRDPSAFPIALLSFGVTRTLELKKIDYEFISCISLESGSLCKLMNPTNELFNHEISPEPNVKDLCILVTFYHVIPSFKKSRLDSTSEHFPMYDSKNMDFNVIHQWDLEQNIFVQLALYKQKLRLYIRQFKCENNVLQPMRFGIVLTSSTFADLINKLYLLNFDSTFSSIVAGNQLIVLVLNQNYCNLQQIFRANMNNYYLKSPGLKLSKEQICKLREFEADITTCFIENRIFKALPRMFSDVTCQLSTHISEDEAKYIFLNYLANEIETCSYSLLKCEGCMHSYASQKQHTCLMTNFYQKYTLNRNNVLLQFNLKAIVGKLENSECVCYYANEDFFKNLDIDYLENYLENSFQKCF